MKVLVIDDEPEALKQIENAISAARGPDGKAFQVTTESDHKAAIRLLDKKRFEVVVTDMYMGPNEDEGLPILRELADKSPITIVLTAYPRIPNCVESMRAGAWDYLEKVPEDGSDAYENLLKSIRNACRDRTENRDAGKARGDTGWIHENIHTLMKKHPGEVVAVLDQKVVDHDTSFAELSKRVKEKFPFAKPAMISIPDTKLDTIE